MLQEGGTFTLHSSKNLELPPIKGKETESQSKKGESDQSSHLSAPTDSAPVSFGKKKTANLQGCFFGGPP